MQLLRDIHFSSEHDHLVGDVLYMGLFVVCVCIFSLWFFFYQLVYLLQRVSEHFYFEPFIKFFVNFIGWCFDCSGMCWYITSGLYKHERTIKNGE